MKTAHPWYETWFNSPYYHLLYEHRSDEEAAQFIHELLSYLNPPTGSLMLDMACGNGRHTRCLAARGFEVWGLDLSVENIKTAKSISAPNTHFEVHDMRDCYRTAFFDYVFNFFTSFGYFDSETDNVKALEVMYQSLKKEGFVLIDFLNIHKISQSLIDHEVITKHGITFHIDRHMSDHHLIKNIQFEADGQRLHFAEKLQTLGQQHFQTYFKQIGFKLVAEFGDYTLNPFNAATSARYIILGKKQ